MKIFLVTTLLSLFAASAEGFCMLESSGNYIECVLRECPNADAQCTISDLTDNCADAEEVCNKVTDECCPECGDAMTRMVNCFLPFCDIDSCGGTAKADVLGGEVSP